MFPFFGSVHFLAWPMSLHVVTVRCLLPRPEAISFDFHLVVKLLLSNSLLFAFFLILPAPKAFSHQFHPAFLLLPHRFLLKQCACQHPQELTTIFPFLFPRFATLFIQVIDIFSTHFSMRFYKSLY